MFFEQEYSYFLQQNVHAYDFNHWMGYELELDSDSEHGDDECEFCIHSTQVKSEVKEEIFNEISDEKPLNEQETGFTMQNILGASEIIQEPVVKQEPEYEFNEEMGYEMELKPDILHIEDECEFCVHSTKVEREVKEETSDEYREQDPHIEDKTSLPMQNNSNQKGLENNWNSCESEEAKKHVSTPKQTPKTDIYSHKKGSTVLKDNGKRHKCNECNYVCAYRSILKVHMRTHTGEKPFKCNQCDHTCAQKGDLKKHMRTHTGEKPFKCNQCDFACTVGSSLKCHMRTHTGEKPYKCNQCRYASAFKTGLKKHMRTHSGEKPFKCNQCKYASTQLGDLKKHIRTHTGEKPFKCNQCDYACAQAGHLKRHMLMHTGEKPFQCDVCNYACRVKGKLRIHMGKHTGEKSHQKDRSSKKFQRIHLLSDDPNGAKKQDIRVAKALWRPF